jgi:hypothetical protein
VAENVPSAAQTIRALAAEDTRADFRTPRQPELADFLRQRAWPNEQRGFGRTFVLPSAQQDVPIWGYYTLAMSRAEEKHFPADQRNFPFRTIPAALLSSIARDHRTPAESRVGEILMRDALRRVLGAANDVACYGVILYAKNDGLVRYYNTRYGFVALELRPSESNPSQLMFLPLRDVRENMRVH